MPRKPVTQTPAAPARTTQPDSDDANRSTRADEVLLFALAVAATACWVGLYRWYGLFENEKNTHFAFEKIPGHFDSPILRRTLVLFVAVSAIYALGYGIVRRAPRLSWGIRLGAAALVLGPAAVNVVLYPVGALDVFNYMIELKLAYFYHANPYLETFKNYRHDPFALPAFLVDVPLFYGPVWLIVSRLPGAVVGYGEWLRLLLAMKVFNLGLLGLTAAAIARYQDGGDGEGQRRRWLAAYAFLANPVVLFEGVGNAHNDVMMTFFLVAALLALKRRPGWSGALLAASALVKFFTAVLLPIFVLVAVLRRWGPRRLVTAVGLAAAVVVIACAPFWAGGEMIDGLRKGTASSQEMYHVSPYSLAQQYEREREVDRLTHNGRTPYAKQYLEAVKLSPEAKQKLQRIFMGIFAVSALVILIGVRRGRPVEAAAVDALALFCLLLTNLYPWYLIPIFAVLVLRRDALGTGYLVAATALGLAYYPFYVWAHFNTEWKMLDVHLFLALFLTAPMVLFLLAETGRWGIRAIAGRRANQGEDDRREWRVERKARASLP